MRRCLLFLTTLVFMVEPQLVAVQGATKNVSLTGYSLLSEERIFPRKAADQRRISISCEFDGSSCVPFEDDAGGGGNGAGGACVVGHICQFEYGRCERREMYGCTYTSANSCAVCMPK